MRKMITLLFSIYVICSMITKKEKLIKATKEHFQRDDVFAGKYDNT
jgi:hypothetical protein